VDISGTESILWLDSELDSYGFVMEDLWGTEAGGTASINTASLAGTTERNPTNYRSFALRTRTPLHFFWPEI
jgi:hypothetical protein